jgi:hypothetical protein
MPHYYSPRAKSKTGAMAPLSNSRHRRPGQAPEAREEAMSAVDATTGDQLSEAFEEWKRAKRAAIMVEKANLPVAPASKAFEPGVDMDFEPSKPARLGRVPFLKHLAEGRRFGGPVSH